MLPRSENTVSPNRLSQLLPIQVCSQAAANPCKGQDDASFGQVLLELQQRAAGGKVYAGNRAGIHHQPSYRGGRLVDQQMCLLDKVIRVGVIARS